MTAAKVLEPEHHDVSSRWFDCSCGPKVAAEATAASIVVNIPLPQPMFTAGHPYILGTGVTSTALHVVDTGIRPVEDVDLGVWLWFALCGAFVEPAGEEPLAWPWCPDCRRRAGLPNLVLPSVEQTHVMAPVEGHGARPGSAPRW